MFETLKMLRRDRHNLIIHEARIALWLSFNYMDSDKSTTLTDRIKSAIMILIGFMSMILPILSYALFGSTDWLESLDVLCRVSSVLSTGSKQLIWFRKREQIRLLLRRLQTEWDENGKLFDEESVRVMAHSKKICHRIAIVMGVWVGLITALYLTFTVVFYIYGIYRRNDPTYVKILPFSVLLPYDVDYGLNYDFTFIVMMFSTYIYGCSVVAFDTIYCGVICHVATQFKLLQIRMEKLNKNWRNYDLVTGNMYLKQLIDRHNACIQLVNETEEIFNGYTFLQFITSSLMICLILFGVWLELGFAAIKSFTYVSAAIAQLFLFSWICESLLASTNSIADAAYQLPWYMFPKAMQNSVLLMMVRGYKPLGITAAKFYLVTYESFEQVNVTYIRFLINNIF